MWWEDRGAWVGDAAGRLVDPYAKPIAAFPALEWNRITTSTLRVARASFRLGVADLGGSAESMTRSSLPLTATASALPVLSVMGWSTLASRGSHGNSRCARARGLAKSSA